MRALIACEESQRVCAAFRKRGWQAFSCDVQECSGGHPEWHIKGDVTPIINGSCTFFTENDNCYQIFGEWDLIIAHPPCTYLSNAGARHLYKGGVLQQDRYKKGIEAKEFFMLFRNADCPHIVIENPTPSRVFDLPPYSQVIQPWMFGHPYQKRTLLWIKGLPELKPTNIVDTRISTKTPGCWFNAKGVDRQKERSKTFQGIADAMAEQWGRYLEELYV